MDSSRRSETATVAVLLRKMCLIRCTSRFQNRPINSIRIDDFLLGDGPEFVQQKADSKDSSRRSETAIVLILLRRMCLVRCTSCFQNRPLSSIRLDEVLLRNGPEFVQQKAERKDSSRRSETTTVAILLRKMCLVRCTSCFQNRPINSIRLDEVLLGNGPEFVQQKAERKDSSRRSETATVAILLRKMCLVRCTSRFQNRPLSSIRIVEVLLGNGPEFVQQKAERKDSSRRSETATVAILLRKM
jgi:hypothetical protein